MIRPIEGKDQEPLAGLIRSVFEEYGAPLLNTVYDAPCTWHVWEALQGVNAGYSVLPHFNSSPSLSYCLRLPVGGAVRVFNYCRSL